MLFRPHKSIEWAIKYTTPLLAAACLVAGAVFLLFPEISPDTNSYRAFGEYAVFVWIISVLGGGLSLYGFFGVGSRPNFYPRIEIIGLFLLIMLILGNTIALWLVLEEHPIRIVFVSIFYIVLSLGLLSRVHLLQLGISAGEEQEWLNDVYYNNTNEDIS